MIKYFCGIDCSSSAIHISILKANSEIKLLEKFSDTTKDSDIRFNLICKQFGEFIKSEPGIFDDAICIIENPVFVQNVRSTSLITHTIAGVKVKLFEQNFKFWGVDVRHWKAQILGNGNSTKEEIMRFSSIKWGDVFKEQDWADAACIALCGIQKFGIK